MKKFFKKYTPDKTVVEKYKILRIIGTPLLHKELWQFSRKPLCGGVAVGFFWGWMPMPFQMLPAAICSIIFRVNFPLSLIGVWISNPITMPPMMYFAYLVGNWLLNLDPQYKVFELTMDWIESAWGNIWEPLLIGSLLLGIISSILSYMTMHIIWKVFLYNKVKERQNINK
ncbi:MAG: DUF2062 domain-containing protein [Pseudomonadota bacterium]|nr:DUF2062 domain-containing protein [Pseudomonadota bacterium]MEC8996377.1 DUF2062 domain-containing protein [Pseudomonadota bacterium]MED5430064.1 DUF2062 domain-containing protein [Pseudomonadota bacterium]|tara:strand:+ start:3465 stop:3977 length:513 start_codon:yes stop_codon:yes gene_type:complete